MYVFTWAVLLEKNPGKFDHYFSVVWQKFMRLFEVLDSALDVFFASDDTPSESEFDLAQDFLS